MHLERPGGEPLNQANRNGRIRTPANAGYKPAALPLSYVPKGVDGGLLLTRRLCKEIFIR